MARTLMWTGAVGSIYSDRNNWDNVAENQNPAASAPGSTDTAVISTNGSVAGTGIASFLNFFQAPVISGTLSADSINVNNALIIASAGSLSGANISTSPGSSMLVLAGGSVAIPAMRSDGASGYTTFQGDLTVDGGQFASDSQLNFGTQPGGTATALVEAGGTLSAWSMFVCQAPGVQAGLSLTGAGTVANVLGSGGGGGYLVIGGGYPSGVGSNGTLTVTNGARLNTTSADLGDAGGTGTASVSAAGFWATQQLTLGGGIHPGPGALTVAAATVSVSGSLHIGAGAGTGTGLLTILAGGTVTGTAASGAGGLALGTYNGTAGGTLVVDGTGARLTVADFSGGNGANGVTIADAGEVDAGNVVFGSGDFRLESGGVFRAAGYFDFASTPTSPQRSPSVLVRC